VPRLARGRTLSPSFRTFSFEGSSLDSLVIYYKPGAGRCLWVLSPQDADNPELPEITLQALPASNLGRISPQPVPGKYPPTDLFGEEPRRAWCYYYQKAELARQFSDWVQIKALAQQARAEGYAPGNPNERLVFIEGYARSGDWEAALEQSLEVYAADQGLAPRLCSLWQRVSAQPLPTALEPLKCGVVP
jgi:hypothetical protein